MTAVLPSRRRLAFITCVVAALVLLLRQLDWNGRLYQKTARNASAGERGGHDETRALLRPPAEPAQPGRLTISATPGASLSSVGDTAATSVGLSGVLGLTPSCAFIPDSEDFNLAAATVHPHDDGSGRYAPLAHQRGDGFCSAADVSLDHSAFNFSACRKFHGDGSTNESFFACGLGNVKEHNPLRPDLNVCCMHAAALVMNCVMSAFDRNMVVDGEPVPWFPMGGTALGFIRNAGFIENDRDADILYAVPNRIADPEGWRKGTEAFARTEKDILSTCAPMVNNVLHYGKPGLDLRSESHFRFKNYARSKAERANAHDSSFLSIDVERLEIFDLSLLGGTPGQTLLARLYRSKLAVRNGRNVFPLSVCSFFGRPVPCPRHSVGFLAELNSSVAFLPSVERLREGFRELYPEIDLTFKGKRPTAIDMIYRWEGRFSLKKLWKPPWATPTNDASPALPALAQSQQCLRKRGFQSLADSGCDQAGVAAGRCSATSTCTASWAEYWHERRKGCKEV